MSDDKTKCGEPDRSLINLSEPYEVGYWTKKFGVTEQQLRDAAKKAGSRSVDKIKKQLGK